MPLDLAFREYGSGPPLILLHGLFGSSTNLRGVANHLARTHRVFTLDLRNHGASPHTAAMDYAAMATDVCAFMERLDLQQVSLLGHSMGGKTAMRVALDYPRRVARLVVVDIAPIAYEHDYSAYFDAMRNLDLERLERRSDADAGLAGVVTDAAQRGFLLQNLVNKQGRFSWRVNLDGIEASMAELLDFPSDDIERPFDGDTMFIGGDMSEYILPRHHPSVRCLFPNAEIETVAQAGHWVHAEQPQRFLQLAERFLSGPGG